MHAFIWPCVVTITCQRHSEILNSLTKTLQSKIFTDNIHIFNFHLCLHYHEQKGQALTSWRNTTSERQTVTFLWVTSKLWAISHKSGCPQNFFAFESNKSTPKGYLRTQQELPYEAPSKSDVFLYESAEVSQDTGSQLDCYHELLPNVSIFCTEWTVEARW